MQKELINAIENTLNNQFVKIETQNRQSGRTARMLVDAINAAMEGHAVYIVCLKQAIPYTRNLAADICKAHNIERPKIKYETLESVGEHNIDWRSKSLYGAHSNCKLFIDHSVYMVKFHDFLEGYHFYDGECPKDFKDLQLKRVPVRHANLSEDVEKKFWSQKIWNET